MAPTCSERKEAAMSPRPINEHTSSFREKERKKRAHKSDERHTRPMLARTRQATEGAHTHLPQQLSNEITDSESRSSYRRKQHRTQARKHRQSSDTDDTIHYQKKKTSHDIGMLREWLPIRPSLLTPS
jgi:hypothetical protein